jgi:hypothetical protein
LPRQPYSFLLQSFCVQQLECSTDLKYTRSDERLPMLVSRELATGVSLGCSPCYKLKHYPATHRNSAVVQSRRDSVAVTSGRSVCGSFRFRVSRNRHKRLTVCPLSPCVSSAARLASAEMMAQQRRVVPCGFAKDCWYHVQLQTCPDPVHRVSASGMH